MSMKSKLTIDEEPKELFHETLLTACRQIRQQNPHKIAFVTSGAESDTATFGQVVQYSNNVASWFHTNGYNKGDVVLTCMDNNWRLAVLCIGGWSAGICVSPASSQATQFELRYQLEDSTAISIVTDPEHLELVQQASQGLNIRHIICLGCSSANVTDFEEICRGQKEISPNIQFDPEDDLIVLPYSSGTTGKPKGVMLTHRNYQYMLASYRKLFEEEYKTGRMVIPSNSLVFLPLYHVMGFCSLFFALRNGTQQIVMKRFETRKFLQNIQDYSITSVTLVPALIVLLAGAAELDEFDLSSWVMVISGSAPLPISTVDKLRKRLPKIIFGQGYGMTEFCVASHLGGPGCPENSIGYLLPGSQMKVKSESGEICGPGIEGEMWIKSPQVMKGYWKREKETLQLFDEEGFMRTGDIVYYDENGCTFISDRIKDLIKVNGKQVAPAELESVLQEIPQVSDACVVGIPDLRSGEIPRGYVVLNGRISDSAIHEHVKKRLAGYKRLKGGIEVVHTLPRTSTGKLLRRKLREQYLTKAKL